ncbi:MAG: peroxiredoxin-like family protein [Sphingobium sp.]
MAESLKEKFAALHAERERTWPAEQLAKNVGTRETLVRKYDPRGHVQVGEIVDPFTLTDSEGATLTRDDLLRDGPAVLIFYRYGGCPACNIALPHYNRYLAPALAEAGIPLVAVSPQSPADATLKDRHGISFTIASDKDNALGNRLGITFEPEDKPEVKPGDSWIGSIAGTNSWALPQPTVLILNADASVRFVEVSPDWMKRTEVDRILSQLPEVRAAAVAA